MRTSLPLLLLTVSLLASGAKAAVMPTHIYTLDGTLADSFGGPSLALSGGAALGATGVSFGAGQGLTLAGSAFADGADYSIAIDFRFDSLPLKYARILNGSGDDNGLYIHSGDGLPYPVVNYYQAGPINAATAFSVGDLHHLLFARDADGSAAYLDGVQVLSTVAFSSQIIGASLSFFLDDNTENAPGFVTSICSYGSRLTGSGATGVSSTDCTGGFTSTPAPEPVSWALFIAGLGAIGTVMRRRKIIVSFA